MSDTRVTMSDVRGITMPAAETSNTTKIVSALIVALGFAAIGGYTYETGVWSAQPRQVMAAKDIPSPGPLPSAAPSVVAPQATDVPPPAPEKIPAQTTPQAAASPPASATPPVRLARTRDPLPEAPAAQESGNASAQASPAPVAPASNPEQSAPQDNNVAPPVSTPSQEATEQPAQSAPAQAEPQPQSGP